MSKTKLSLLLLSSFAFTNFAISDESNKEKHICSDKNCTSSKESVDSSTLSVDDAIEELGTKLEQSMRTSFLNFMETTQEELHRVHTELQSVGDKLKEKIAITQTKLTEESNTIKLEFQLPSDFKFESTHNVDIINDKIISLSLKDEKYSISINCILDKHRLKGTIRIDSVEANEKGVSKKSHQESSFEHRVFIGKTNLENLTVSFDKERHTLTFSIPKEFEADAKRSVKISVK